MPTPPPDPTGLGLEIKSSLYATFCLIAIIHLALVDLRFKMYYNYCMKLTKKKNLRGQRSWYSVRNDN